MIKGILFDLDGTILETETSRFFSLKKVLKNLIYLLQKKCGMMNLKKLPQF